MGLTLNTADKLLIYKTSQALFTNLDKKKQEQLFLKFEDKKVSLCALKLIKKYLELISSLQNVLQLATDTNKTIYKKFQMKTIVLEKMMSAYLKNEKFSHAFELAQIPLPTKYTNQEVFLNKFKATSMAQILLAFADKNQTTELKEFYNKIKVDDREGVLKKLEKLNPSTKKLLENSISG